ncbi:hypothetical protein AVEN_87473-1 [Araneus ventricosus]|uniref:Uncharacterized protein n=1 Tax=Araneus ventricosus TaxID=182803 RepID=A0A4Y2KX25_ARAVE|nr:hypothetical protein AVEN_87473-1 [Araneus ventricosus]
MGRSRMNWLLFYEVFIRKKLLESVFECNFEGFETVPVKPAVNEIESLAKIIELEMDNYTYGPMKDYSQEQINEEPPDLHCVSQQKFVQEKLSEEEEKEVTGKQQTFGAITEMLKEWGTIGIVH